MTIEAYTNPDFGTPEKIIYFIMAFIGVLLCVGVILFGARLSAKKSAANGEAVDFFTLSKNRVQLFYEMIISGTSVLSFSCAYIISNHLYMLALYHGHSATTGRFAPYIALWESRKDFFLLLMICMSCVLNTLLDKLIIPLKGISKEEKASIRLLAMFYVIVILMYLNRIGDENEYNPAMMYYLGLMVGRFIYFDASFTDFLSTMWRSIKNGYMLILGLLLTGVLCFFGFRLGFLLPRNYYIMGIFYTDLFLLAVIFVIHHLRLIELPFRKLLEEPEINEK